MHNVPSESLCVLELEAQMFLAFQTVCFTHSCFVKHALWAE